MVRKGRKEHEAQYWGKVAPRYDDWIGEAFAEQYLVFKRTFAESVGPDDRVLDMATGTGLIAFSLAKHCKEVVGVDISSRMIEEAVEKAKGTGAKGKVPVFRQGDAYDLPFEDDSFDKIVCCVALQTMDQPDKAIGEAYRVLRPGGNFLSVTYCYGDTSVLERMKLLKWIIKYGKPKYWHNFKAKELLQIFKDAGFMIDEERVIWETPKILFLDCIK